MAQKTPLKGIFSGSVATGIGEFASTDTVDYSDGGTGLATLGSAGQILKVNSGASALEYGNVEAVINIDGMTDGSAVTLHLTQDKIPFSDNGTEKYFTPTTLNTFLSSTTQTLTNKTLTSPVLNSTISGTSIKDEDTMSSDSATHLATQQSIKAYVDSTVTGEDLDVTSDSGTIDIDLDSETLTIAGGSGIDTSGSSSTITIAGEDASTSNKGVASFSSSDFSVSSGAVTVKSSGITSTQLAGSIANAKLSNSSITVSDGSNTSPIALGGTLTFAGTSNEVDVAESAGTVTIGLPNNVTISGNLTVSGTTTEVSSTTINIADPLLSMATNNNSSDAVDIGFYGLYDTSGSQDLYGGLFRDAGDSGKWKLFKDNQAAPTTTVNVSGTGYAVATLVADLEGAVTGNADTATALATGRTVGMTGDVVWTSASFTGSGNVTGTATIQAGSVDNAMLAGSITNANLQNSSITLGDASSSIMTISLGQQFSVIGSNGCTTSLDNNILTINTAGAEATGYAAALALG